MLQMGLLKSPVTLETLVLYLTLLIIQPKFDSYEKGIMGAMKIAHSARIVANPIRQHQG
jgi:hypothetical protein